MALPKLASNLQRAGKRIIQGELKGAIEEAKSASREKWYAGKKGQSETQRSVAKQRSDMIYNERRRAKRLINRLEIDYATQTGTQRAATRSYINYLKREVQKTYAPRKGTRRADERQMAAVKNLRKETYGTARMGTLTKQERVNAIVKHQLRLAYNGLDSTFGVGELGRAKTKIFFRSTQNIWQGAPASERLRLIQEYYGGASLEEVWLAIMRDNEEAIAAIAEGSYVETTEEGSFYTEEEGYSESAGSPDYLDYVKSAIYIAL